MREGGCLCGAVRYQVDGDPIASGICRCVTCRRTASAPQLPFAGFPRAAFSVTRGTPARYRSSPHVERGFCGRCGSPLNYSNDQDPATLDIMTCSLDDPDAVPPTYSVWLSHKVSWDPAAETLPAFDESRPG